MSDKPLRRKAKQERSQATVEVILIAASQVLEKEGYGFATTDKIAIRAGVSVGTVYQYFNNKDEIFDLLLDRSASQFLARLNAFTIDESLPFAQNLRRFVAREGRYSDINPELYRELRRIPNGEAKITALIQGIIDAVSHFIRWYRPDVSPQKLDRMARMVTMAAQGMGHLSSRGELNNGLLLEYLNMMEIYLTVGLPS